MAGRENKIHLFVTYASAVLLCFYLLKAAPWLAIIFFSVSLVVISYRWISRNRLAQADNRLSQKKISEFSRRNLIQYTAWLKENIRGHNNILNNMLPVIQRNITLVNEHRTLGTIFLCGPTGTGKTFTAEIIAQALYPKSAPIIIRMNQYKSAGDVQTLLGPPPGYPGHEIGGALTRPVLEDPERVIILDEIDKCHKDVLDCFYNILDTAQCTEKSSGKIVNFSRCLFFATSNVAVDALRMIDSKNSSQPYLNSKYREVISENSSMDKAFLARWSHIFFMDSLPSINVAEVACLQIRKYWKQFGIDVVYTSPELLVQTVKSNLEFKEFGVRQLSNHIKMSTDSQISEAKHRGFKKVCLDVNPRTQQINVKGVA